MRDRDGKRKIEPKKVSSTHAPHITANCSQCRTWKSSKSSQTIKYEKRINFVGLGFSSSYFGECVRVSVFASAFGFGDILNKSAH